MQDTLLKEMREEYHKKISAAVEEIRRLETEKQESITKSATHAQKTKVEDAFKKKQDELKLKLKELETKQKQEAQLSKALNQQKLKTKSVEHELEKIKTQKVVMMKKIKEEQENRARIQKQGAKEKADLKRKLARQQKELDTIVTPAISRYNLKMNKAGHRQRRGGHRCHGVTARKRGFARAVRQDPVG